MAKGEAARSMNSGWKIAAVTGAVGFLAVGGYFTNEHLACKGLEEDYLNGVSKIKSATQLKAMDGISEDVEVSDLARLSLDQGMKEIETAQRSLLSRCGDRASDSALRKGQEMLGVL